MGRKIGLRVLRPRNLYGQLTSAADKKDSIRISKQTWNQHDDPELFVPMFILSRRKRKG